ncbi:MULTISPECIES: ABC transporter ATP-binding protein [Methylorubrum]|jgi:ATP-binding cassette subfamily B protein|uniref:ABC transporter, fused ATPase and transmembrane permease domains n=2 Tax=Methylorubrum extorquens TaxID=408 RepID=C5B2D4_METEA|nr:MULTISPECIES: ABC transporter ATP-binding protein [Methylorubrum]ACS39789.1 putative ABC transporter, fused ATPase and transmembrane permease domains [Methylorubrum extorquens AM1]EHP93514.1 Xenobiotic-transporting ATPase [Methylorubrum extorquens DSM 13060]MCP1542073.1 ATP-binding cassette subfamily B protein [Methylorubrum extorquens]MCP1590582.1 ATP-binding cassette subfamily B protein [Methylorubrum extorquens]BDL39391.1 multidrug ABC transporter ATP-binding protein [Methylorubrum sp. G
MLKAFLAYYRPHRTLFLVDFGCAVLSGLLELGFPLAVKAFVDRLLPQQDWSLILLAAMGLTLLYVANAGLMVVVTYWGHVLGINIETEMRARAFDHLQKLSFRFFDGQKTGHLVARITKDLEEIGEVAHHGPEDLFIAVMTLFGAFALMFLVHPPLALMTLAILPLIAFIVIRYGGRMTRNWQAQYGRVGAFNARIEENVGGIRVVKAFANEAHERALFASDNRNYRTTKLEAYRLMAGALSINYLGLRLVQIVVLLGGAAFVVRGDLTPGGFVGFLLLVAVFYRPLEKIGAVIETYPKGIAGFRRYQDLLATEPDIADRPGAIPAPPLKGEIRFEGVRFGYSPDRPVLSAIDLTIHAGETVAFVGPSGAGKTTLLSLIPRFYEAEAGRITIDGHDIRDLTLASLRGQIGIVQQDVFLFAGTIRENIAYGRLRASEAEILDAAARARLDGLIASLPEGLDTVIGERGVKLSGGQKQRLAIARAFLKNPPILILDEATSALDTQTEREIQASLFELAEGRTTLVIAHRLATIRHADRIVVVAENGIVEQGRHDVLLAGDGYYRRLHAAQVEDSHPSRPRTAAE